MQLMIFFVWIFYGSNDSYNLFYWYKTYIWILYS